MSYINILSGMSSGNPTILEGGPGGGDTGSGGPRPPPLSFRLLSLVTLAQNTLKTPLPH